MTLDLIFSSLDLIFEKEFALFHNSSSSVYFCGYKTDAVREENEFDTEEDDEFADSDEDDKEDIPSPVQLAAKENGKPGLKATNFQVPATKKVEVPVVDAKTQVSKAKPALKEEKGKAGEKGDDDDDEDDSDDNDEDDDEDDDMPESGSEDEDLDSDESEEEDDSEEEQPKSAGKKRPLPGVQNIGSGKKGKITTPLGGAKPGKTDPRTPSAAALTPKQHQRGKKDISAKKTPGKENSSQVGTPASGKKLGQYLCQPCNKNFTTESALSQHKTAKHK